MQITTDFSDATAAQSRTSNTNLRGRILKLRWMGMEDEAPEMSQWLAKAVPLDCPLIDPRDTD
jgi:hypothetical protein